MYWRLPRSRYDAGKGAPNKRALRSIVAAGKPSGLIGYRDQEPVGWIAVAPRPDYEGLGRSRILQPVDDQPVWSVTCFFIARKHRGTGVSVALLESAARHARRKGARILEGYPTEPRSGRMADVFAFTGTAAAFQRAGFREVARRSATRPIMRLDLRA
jgi:GNAT superfamily N-acetyltransferase